MKRWSLSLLIAVLAVASVVGVSSAAIAATHQTAHSGVVPLAAAEPQTTPETQFVAVAPCRIVDTRVAGGPIAPGASRAFYVGGTTQFVSQGGQAGGCGVPLAATGVAATVAVSKPAGAGYLAAWANGAAQPTAATLNYVKAAGAISTGTTLTIHAGVAQSLRVKNQGPPASVIIDVSGYYLPQIQGLIGSDGSLSTGTSRILSASHPGTGSYYVTLDRPARQCSPSAATYNLYRYASVGLSSSTTPNVISVYVWSLDPTTHKEVPSNYPFFLTVTC
jgi:hypothetical protein